MTKNRIDVEVVAATPQRQALLGVSVQQGATVADAIDASSVASTLPGFDVQSCPVAIWGRIVSRSDSLKDGDRIELLRPLLIDPREARRKLAEAGKVMGVAGTKSEPGKKTR